MNKHMTAEEAREQGYNIPEDVLSVVINEEGVIAPTCIRMEDGNYIGSIVQFLS